ncbi:MAG: hypothetical protein KDB90_07270 [Planctomycetes bacterium]|nr:hypothetical protein [Planctomycetota bacterium]
MLASLKAEYESKGVYFISLTIEPNDDASAVASWLKRAGAESLNTARASDGVKDQMIRMGGAEPGAIPANVMISAGGEVTRSLVAPFKHADLESAVAALAN